MQLQIGHVDCDPRTLDKRSNFSGHNVLTLNDVEISQPCNVKNPKFLLDITHVSPGYNYAYVPAWGAYYFLAEPTVIDGVRATVSGTLDPLTTYADSILALHAYLIRTGTAADRNQYLNDGNRPMQENTHVHTYQFNASPFTANYTSDITYLLTVIGGNHSSTQGGA